MTVSAPVASTYQRLGSPSDSESADLDELLESWPETPVDLARGYTPGNQG